MAAIQAVFAQYPAVEEVVLYGSRAKGTFKPGSDIDLTIREHGMSLDDVLRLETQLDDLLLPYKVDLSLFRQIQHAPLLEHIQRAGVSFYVRRSA
ncbi:MAG: nucleotidyltransferase domain-containing protein [bacterium]